MKILSVNTVLDNVLGGGTAERTFQMSRFLAQAGVSCTVLTLDLGLKTDRIERLQPATVVALHCTIPRYYLFTLPEPRIESLVREADVVHLMGHWTLLNALVARVCRRLKKPYVVCPAGALPIYGRSRWLKSLYNRITGNQLIADASACVAIATNEIAQYSEYGIHADRITTIPNGIDAADFQYADNAAFRAKFRLPDAPFVLFLGRLAPIKGPDLLLQAYIKAATALGKMHLVFAGPDGGMLEMLRSEAAASGFADRIHFIGAVSGADKSRAYHAAALLAIPSRQEAMSIVVLEAGICGTPVLITDCCGFGEVAGSGGGIVVNATAEGLQAGLKQLLASPENLPAMGNALQVFTRENYLWQHVVKDYIALFRRLTLAHPES
jgi:glycosyltransferase involved in cell wall biosynthesis